MAYPVVQSEVEFQGKAFAVRRDDVLRPDGRTMRVEVVEHPGAIALVPVDEAGRIWFVRQYRHAAGQTLIELPAGTLNAGEDPLACARRECREEIGMAPGRLIRLGEFFMAPGYSSELITMFLATELAPDPLAPDEDEDLQVERLTPDQADVLIASGELRDSKSLAGLYLWSAYRARA
jgi:ADP-ribose pyrophosphatase